MGTDGRADVARKSNPISDIFNPTWRARACVRSFLPWPILFIWKLFILPFYLFSEGLISILHPWEAFDKDCLSLRTFCMLRTFYTKTEIRYILELTIYILSKLSTLRVSHLLFLSTLVVVFLQLTTTTDPLLRIVFSIAGSVFSCSHTTGYEPKYTLFPFSFILWRDAPRQRNLLWQPYLQVTSLFFDWLLHWTHPRRDISSSKAHPVNELGSFWIWFFG